MSTIDDVIERVRAEYMEMPGLSLTAAQVQRLCGIERMVCAVALGSLVQAGFLCIKPDGHYARVTDGAFSRPRAAKAYLTIDTFANKAS